MRAILLCIGAIIFVALGWYQKHKYETAYQGYCSYPAGNEWVLKSPDQRELIGVNRVNLDKNPPCNDGPRYIGEHGDDSNHGMTHDKAWKTLKNLQGAK